MAAEVVMDGIEFISAELDLPFEVTQNQGQAFQIKRAPYQAQRDTKQDPNLLASVTARRLHVQQKDKILRSALTTSSKGYAMMRTANLREGNSNKVVMWTGGSYEYDDVIRALLRLDRPEIQPGTTPYKATPVYYTEPKSSSTPRRKLDSEQLCREAFSG